MSEHRHRSKRSSASYGLTKDQLNEIEEAFNIFDDDKSGTIEVSELKTALRAMGFELSKKEIADIVREKDPKGNKSLKKDDFFDVCARLVSKRDPLKEIKRLFLLFSSDHEFITKRDLKKIAKELGEEMDDAEIDEMITRFDTDKDGKINEAEFIAIMDPANKYN
jgi:centrin-3